jgi:Xaa-Pro aminopeptidase
MVGVGETMGSQVGSGPNGALPHVAPAGRVIQLGEPVVVDFGAVHQGYYSDCTRTVHTGPPSEEFIKASEIVRRASYAAQAAVVRCPHPL